MKRLASILLVLVLALTLTAPAMAADAGETVVTIYTTNDIHGTMSPGEDQDSQVIGLAQAAAIAASTENALLVDAGDATQGTSFATVTEGADVIAAMNAAGYAVMAAGNHDFDYGKDRLLQNAALADFPILSANAMDGDEQLLEPSTVIEVAGKRIGFIGLTTTDTATSTNPSLLGGVTFEDEVTAAKEQLAALAPDTDAIVLICHMGDNDLAVDCTSTELLDALSDEELAQVTALVDGHSHTVEEAAYTERGANIPIVQTGTLFTRLGVIEITFGEDGVSAEGSLLESEDAAAFPLTDAGTEAAAAVETALQEITEGQLTILGEELCTNEAPLWGGYIYYDYAEPRIVETAFGDFVTDAFASAAAVFAEAQELEMPIVAIENGGGVSATLPVGQVTRGDVLNAFNHGNLVEVLNVTPAELYTALEAGLTMTGQDETGLLIRERVSGSFMQVSGFTYSFDPAGEEGAKVTAVTLDDGTALDREDEETELLLVTNGYVASGFPEEDKLGELGGEDMIVEDYLLAQTHEGTVPLDWPTVLDRIIIDNDQSPDTYDVTVPVSVAGSEDPAADMALHLRVDGGEYEDVETDGDGNLHLTLDKGPHTLYLQESADGVPVYVNNYSGSGTVTVKPGYYSLAFVVDVAA